MDRFQMFTHGRSGRARLMTFQAGVLGLMLAIALPAMAGDARSVKARVAPVYPEIAKRMRVSGTVRLEADVDAQGKVTDVKELSGNHTLALAAKDAVLHWRFAPASSGTHESIAISFDLGQD